MAKAAALEEMNLIYQAFADYFSGKEMSSGVTLTELMASYRSFCIREPIGGMFLESVIEDLMDRAMDGQRS